MSISPLCDLTVLGHLGGEVQQLQDDLVAQLVVPLVVLLGPITEILPVEGQVVLQPGSLLLLLLASQLLGSVCICVLCVCVCVCMMCVVCTCSKCLIPMQFLSPTAPRVCKFMHTYSTSVYPHLKGPTHRLSVEGLLELLQSLFLKLLLAQDPAIGRSLLSHDHFTQPTRHGNNIVYVLVY